MGHASEAQVAPHAIVIGERVPGQRDHWRPDGRQRSIRRSWGKRLYNRGLTRNSFWFTKKVICVRA